MYNSYDFAEFIQKGRQNMDVKVSGKINLSLDILDVMDNGYHQIDTVIQSVDVYDILNIDLAEEISINCIGIPKEQNSAYKAAKVFFYAKNISGGCRINITKGIPFSAGMGGSSADAAATLYALNLLYGHPYSEKELIDLSGTIGADVPFLLAGGCKRCRGIGEMLEDIDSALVFTALAVKGDGLITSCDAYKMYDNLGGPHPDTDEVIAALQNNDMNRFKLHTANSLETACFSVCPDSHTVKDIFESDSRCITSFLTGSGSAVIGIYIDDKDAESAAALFGNRECHVIHPTDRSVII